MMYPGLCPENNHHDRIYSVLYSLLYIYIYIDLHRYILEISSDSAMGKQSEQEAVCGHFSFFGCFESF